MMRVAILAALCGSAAAVAGGVYSSYTQLVNAASALSPEIRPTVQAAMEAGTCIGVQPAEAVQIEFFVTELTVIQKSESFTLDGFLRLWWQDSRFQFDAGLCNTTTFVTSAPATSTWSPDVYFEMATQVNVAGAGGKNAKEGKRALHVHSNGTLYYERSIQATFNCNFGFGRFPVDTHNCPLIAGVKGEASDVTLAWKDKTVPAGHFLPGTKKGEWEARTITGLDTVTGGVSHAGGASFAKACVGIYRIGNSSIVMLMLAVLFVLISYAGFWIPPTIAPARVTLAVVCVLIVSNYYISYLNMIPKTGYSIWILDFMFMVSHCRPELSHSVPLHCADG